MSNVSEKDNGVYFATKDYASLPKRIIVAVIDLTILILFAWLVSWLWSFWAESPNVEVIAEFGWLSAALFNPTYFWVITGTAYFYLSIAKRSETRTVGYRVVGLKIIDENGRKPSLFKMSFRFILLVFGPFHLLVDLIWLGGDEGRQTLRDKFVGTYVIREDAKPIGVGNIEYVSYNFMGLSLLFREIKRAVAD